MADPSSTPDETDDAAPEIYDPSEVEATLARQQGLGVGLRDLQRQRDASEPAPAADEDDDGESGQPA